MWIDGDWNGLASLHSAPKESQKWESLRIAYVNGDQLDAVK